MNFGGPSLGAAGRAGVFGSVLSIGLVLSIAAIKMEFWRGVDFGMLMWAEDGKVFLKQAVEMGVWALPRPNAGYLHMYPRLVALLSGAVSLHLRPVVFFSGWMLSLALMAWFGYRRAVKFGVNPAVVVLAMLLMVSQPHSGEVFFTLTNAQWFLAIVLAILLLFPDSNYGGWREVMAVAILGLTGPFVIIFFPALIFQAWFLKKWARQKNVLLVAAAASVVQLICILSGPARGGADILPSIGDWVKALETFFLFGSQSSGGVIAAVVFWCLLFSALILDLRRSGENYRSVALAFIIAAGLAYAAGLQAVRADLNFISPFGAGSRYFFVPYALVFYSACVMKKAGAVLVVLVFVSAIAVQLFAWHDSKVAFVGLLSRVDRGTTKNLLLAEERPQLIEINPSGHWGFTLGPSPESSR